MPQVCARARARQHEDDCVSKASGACATSRVVTLFQDFGGTMERDNRSGAEHTAIGAEKHIATK